MPTIKVYPIHRVAITPKAGERYTPKGYTQKMSSQGKIYGIVTIEKLPQQKNKPKERILYSMTFFLIIYKLFTK